MGEANQLRGLLNWRFEKRRPTGELLYTRVLCALLCNTQRG